MKKSFVSHSSVDNPLVDAMRRALEDSGQVTWLDARELRGGDILEDKICAAIAAADAFIIFVSPAGLQSKWVGKELTIALDIQKQRGRDVFPIVPLSIDDTRLGVLEPFFDGEPIYIPVSSEAGGIEEALPKILAAIGVQLPTCEKPARQPDTQPLEELLFELTRPTGKASAGKRRVCAEATIALTAGFFRVLQNLGKPRSLAKIGATRESAAKALGSTTWSHAQFEARRARIEQQLNSGQLSGALAGARDLHQRALVAGESAYGGADYDTAGACWLLGRVLSSVGAAGQALPLLQEAQRRFEAIDKARDNRAAKRMASVSLAE